MSTPTSQGAPAGARMSYKPEAERADFMSRGERHKLVIMVAVLGLIVGVVFQGGRIQSGPVEGIPVSPGPRPRAVEPEPGMIPRAGQDAARALSTLQRYEEERARGASAPAAAAPFVYDPTIVAQVQDGALDVVEEPAFYQLVARLHFMSDEELAAAPQAHGTFLWDDLKQPAGRDAARGKFVHLRGELLIPLFQRVLERYPNETGTDLAWVWQGVLRSSDYRGYFVTITDKTFDPEPGEPIELTAAFLKGYRFETGEGVKSMPHVVARSVRRLPPLVRGDAMHHPMLLVATGVLAGIALAVVLYGAGSRRGARAFEAWRQRRLYAPAKKGKMAAAQASVEHPAAPPVEPAAAASAGAPGDPAPAAPAPADPSPVDPAPAASVATSEAASVAGAETSAPATSEPGPATSEPGAPPAPPGAASPPA
jgi:hypothetical protein